MVGVVRALDNEGRVAYVRPARLGAALTDRPQIAVRVAPGASRDAVRRRLTQRVSRGPRPAVVSVVSGAAGDSVSLLGLLSAVLRVVGGVVALVILYALAQALALTAAERTSSLALLRTLGGSATTTAAVLAGAGAALVLPAAALAIALQELVLGPVVSAMAAGYATLPVRASAGQAAAVTGGLVILAAVAAGWVARRLRRVPARRRAAGAAVRGAVLVALVLLGAALAGCGARRPAAGRRRLDVARHAARPRRRRRPRPRTRRAAARPRRPRPAGAHPRDVRADRRRARA